MLPAAKCHTNPHSMTAVRADAIAMSLALCKVRGGVGKAHEASRARVCCC